LPKSHFFVKNGKVDGNGETCITQTKVGHMKKLYFDKIICKLESEPFRTDWAREDAAYARQRDRLVCEHLSKFVVLYQDEVLGPFGWFEEAVKEGNRQFGNVQLAVQRIRAEEPPRNTTISGFKNAGSIWTGEAYSFPGSSELARFVVVLADEYLYQQDFSTEAARFEAVCRLCHLEDGETADTVLGRDAQKIHLPSIKELRLSAVLRLLEIYHDGPSNPWVIQTERDALPEWVFVALWDRLAPDVESTEGSASRRSALAMPVFALVVALIISAGFIFWASVAVANPKNVGFRAGGVNFIERILFNIGLTGTTAIASVIVLGLIGWIIYCWQYPPSALVITIPGREG
jgi:hypothetical protein